MSTKKSEQEDNKVVRIIKLAAELIESIIEAVEAPQSGYISKIACAEVGICSLILGGGRETMDDIIDPNVGVVLVKKIEDYVKPGDVLAYVHSNGKNTNLVLERVKNAYQYGEIKVHKELILKVIR